MSQSVTKTRKVLSPQDSQISRQVLFIAPVTLISKLSHASSHRKKHHSARTITLQELSLRVSQQLLLNDFVSVYNTTIQMSTEITSKGVI